MNKEYNGWTNYATWRVNMEILGDIEFDEIVSADGLKVRLIIDDKIIRDLVSWCPYYIYGLKKGEHKITLELIDKQKKIGAFYEQIINAL